MSSETRMHRYVIAAASVPLATMTTTQSVVADIVYEGVGQTIGGFSSQPGYLVIGIGGYGSVDALGTARTSAMSSRLSRQRLGQLGYVP